MQGISVGGAPVSLGYKIGQDRKYEIDPIGAKAVEIIFTMYAEGKSPTQICEYLNGKGYRTSRGNPFNKNSLPRILRNNKYIGVYRYGDIVIEDGFPAIISESLFDRVQARLKHNEKVRAKNKAKEDYLLTTMLFCGPCGSPMIGESGTSRTGKVYHYYKCGKRKRGGKCPKAIEKKDYIEAVVVRYIVEQVLTDETIDRIATKAMELFEKEAADNSLLTSLEAALKEAKKKIKNLIGMMEQGICNSSMKERLDELEEEKLNLEGQIAREEMKKPLLTKERIAYWLTSFKSGDVNDVEYQRRIIDTLVNSVFVYDGEDGGKRLVLTFNISGQNTATLTSSDIERYAPPKQHNPNLFPIGDGFGLVVYLDSINA